LFIFDVGLLFAVVAPHVIVLKEQRFLLLVKSCIIASMKFSFIRVSFGAVTLYQSSGFMDTSRVARTSALHVNIVPNSQLEQLAAMTTLSIDSGDITVIEDFARTGYITDATTNPLFVSQAGLSGDPLYANMVDAAVDYSIENAESFDDVVPLAMDRLAVNLGKSISNIVVGYISTEVDPRLSFDVDASVQRGRRIIDMYHRLGVPKERVLIKLAATWEGIKAAEILEREGIQCNLTLVFSVTQAFACAQYGVHLISPFPGRILDYHNTAQGRTKGVEPEQDEGVIACRQMYNYFKCHGHETICMPASWRPSRGPGHELDEILALAGTDRMTIPAPLLTKLAESTQPVERKLDPSKTESVPWESKVAGRPMGQKEFYDRLQQDPCGREKLGDGIRAFVAETEKLEQVMIAKVQAVRA
jgi:transaldolase